MPWLRHGEPFGASSLAGKTLDFLFPIDFVDDQTGNELGIKVSRFLRHFLAAAGDRKYLPCFWWVENKCRLEIFFLQALKYHLFILGITNSLTSDLLFRSETEDVLQDQQMKCRYVEFTERRA